MGESPAIFDIGLDFFPLLAGTLAAVGCGVLGNFLVLRRLSLMGDAISHSVLPGLVIAFLITGTRSPLVMFGGAAVAGVATVVLVELVKRLGRVEPGAAMGVVFSVLFALGVLLIEQAAADLVDLDAECVLHGQLELLWWADAPDSLAGLWDWSTVEATPRQVWVLLAMAGLSIAFVVGLFKELRIAAFDPALATTQGFNASLLHFLLMVFVAMATVASFEAVGSILVIAMLVCPAATARLVTDRLKPQIAWSVVFSLICGIGGYFGASGVPALFGLDAVNSAGAMAVCAGVLLAGAIVLSPRHGAIARLVRQRRLAVTVAVEDLLAGLYRARERGVDGLSLRDARELLAGRPAARALESARRAAAIEIDEGVARLTEAGVARARGIVRRHRLWEHYLVDEAGIAPDHVHTIAEQLEHVRTHPERAVTTDPHGSPIPDRS